MSTDDSLKATARKAGVAYLVILFIAPINEFLRLGSSGTVIATFFWGLWLLPFGSLVVKSGFYPRILGVLLIAGGVTYMVLGFTGLVLPAFAPLVFKWGMPFYAAGEVAIIFWLLFKEPRIPGRRPHISETPVAA